MMHDFTVLPTPTPPPLFNPAGADVQPCPPFEWITANLENAKLLMQHESDNKREADKLIARV